MGSRPMKRKDKINQMIKIIIIIVVVIIIITVSHSLSYYAGLTLGASCHPQPQVLGLLHVQQASKNPCRPK